MRHPPQKSQQSTDADDRPPESPVEPGTPGLLSHSDPEPASTGRPPLWLVVVIALLVTGFVVLHLTGVFGPGTH